jgi:hypothetical protein
MRESGELDAKINALLSLSRDIYVVCHVRCKRLYYKLIEAGMLVCGHDLLTKVNQLYLALLCFALFIDLPLTHNCLRLTLAVKMRESFERERYFYTRIDRLELN